MSSEERSALLKDLDSAVWVEKRLFPARLLVLDKLEKNHRAEEFVKKVMRSLLTDGDEPYDLTETLDKLMILMRNRLRVTDPQTCLEQFCSDLLTFGLREALSYLFENEALKISQEVRKDMIQHYLKIGKAFLRRSDEVRKILEKTHKQFLRKDEDAPDPLDRLIVLDAISFGKPWGDGQRQENFGTKKVKK